ncbi:MAG: formate dehydrogenase accessory sulfurtransferase FdhD [candidate division KSB1 bacterium]|nr:formate dehydrogenase accessory sulfurtransferase FdhD [candidate division KSB1 bacterium]MDZ7358230.1 formate dehydrogenase accessory sulfurtransferase FdhD [candidate division KSB1 bacterium]MDZ7401853.1 formate dehydrogenase accessory sulfurtransferase FdhD [candidate division KSB1 bacterium]
MDDLLEKIAIVQIADDKRFELDDVVVKETPLTIFVNDEELVTLLCLPQHQKNLAIGFLFSEGIITSKVEIESLHFNANRGLVWIKLNKPFAIDDNFRRGRTVTTGCARGLTFHQIFEKWNGDFVSSKLTIDHRIIPALLTDFKNRSQLFRATGGTHSALLYQEDRFLLEREDIGRHNAIDKIIGECVMHDIPGADKILMTSGRVSSEILLKTARYQIPILISHGAPTSAALKLAEEIGMTLVGFARGKRMNIYTNDWRIK